MEPEPSSLVPPRIISVLSIILIRDNSLMKAICELLTAEQVEKKDVYSKGADSQLDVFLRI
jgi:hypothetical protein